MKIKPEHYNYMKRAIKCATIDKNLFEIEGEYRVGGLTPVRFRWDCLVAAKLWPWVLSDLYEYLDDTQIDTALRSVMRELNCEWAAHKA